MYLLISFIVLFFSIESLKEKILIIVIHFYISYQLTCYRSLFILYNVWILFYFYLTILPETIPDDLKLNIENEWTFNVNINRQLLGILTKYQEKDVIWLDRKLFSYNEMAIKTRKQYIIDDYFKLTNSNNIIVDMCYDNILNCIRSPL